MLPPSEMGGEELLRSVARFQKEMLRKREEQGALLAKEPKSQKEKGGGILQFCSEKLCPSNFPIFSDRYMEPDDILKVSFFFMQKRFQRNVTFLVQYLKSVYVYVFQRPSSRPGSRETTPCSVLDAPSEA